MFPWLTRKLDGRLYEWAMSLATLELSIELMVWPGTFERSLFGWVGSSIAPIHLMIMLFIIGSVRVFALMINGSSELLGPIARSLCAAASAILWSQFVYTLYLVGLERNAPSPALSFWVMFTLAEIYVSYRAMMDVRRFTQ